MTHRLIPTDPATRTQLITGLRQLADYLDAHPALPVTEYGWELLNFTRCPDGDQAERAEVDHVADLLGMQVRDETGDGGHYTAARTFGPVTYKFIHIPARRRALHQAHMSYAGVVVPDEPSGAAQ